MSRRIILLGASNLNMGLARILRGLERAFDGPLDVYAALGHGRSFGIWSRILYRGLPGIVDCGLWRAIEASDEQPDETLGLLTDVGNDLLFGVDVPQIAKWAETCIARMQSHGARVTLTCLPIDCVERLKPWRFYATRALFFPGSRISFEEIQRRSRELNRRLIDIARERGAAVVELPGEWYGIDPIHFRHLRRHEAWQRILSAWPGFPPETPVGAASPWAAGRVFCTQPELCRLLGRERSSPQPTLVRGRTRLSLY